MDVRMNHHVKINGADYGITGGRALIGGAGYGITGGKALINGAAYDINFEKYKFSYETDMGSATAGTLTVTDEGSYIYACIKVNMPASTNTTRAVIYMHLDGLQPGDTVTVKYSTSLGSYRNYYIYNRGRPSGQDLLDTYSTVSNVTKTFTLSSDRMTFQVDCGSRGNDVVAWIKLHSISINGEPFYPY